MVGDNGRTCVMGLHALQGMNKKTPPGQGDLAFGGGDLALDDAARPETVKHGAPGMTKVVAKETGAILTSLEARGSAGESDVDEAVRVDGGLQGKGVTLVVEGDKEVVAANCVHGFVK